MRAGLAPAYVYCGWLVMSRLRRRKPALWVLTYAGAAAVVLVPSPLMEPRWVGWGNAGQFKNIFVAFAWLRTTIVVQENYIVVVRRMAPQTS